MPASIHDIRQPTGTEIHGERPGARRQDWLFRSARLAARELVPHEVPRLQALFDANPLYFEAVNGRPPKPDEAQQEFDELPPPHLPFTRRWFLGLFDSSDVGAGVIEGGGEGEGEGGDADLQGVAVVVEDLCAPGVWHIALYLLATALHGSGAASDAYHAMEAWMRRGGARWLRLGVVAGNARAERFWRAQGFAEVRRREGIDTGGRVNDLRVLAKTLDGGTPADYLALVPRDRPDSTLP
jgi:RimJ/RimL family protein N-acetyltransferase